MLIIMGMLLILVMMIPLQSQTILIREEYFPSVNDRQYATVGRNQNWGIQMKSTISNQKRKIISLPFRLSNWSLNTVRLVVFYKIVWYCVLASLVMDYAFWKFP